MISQPWLGLKFIPPKLCASLVWPTERDPQYHTKIEHLRTFENYNYIYPRLCWCGQCCDCKTNALTTSKDSDYPRRTVCMWAPLHTPLVCSCSIDEASSCYSCSSRSLEGTAGGRPGLNSQSHWQAGDWGVGRFSPSFSTCLAEYIFFTLHHV